jgi:hypothetical protein
LSKVGIGEAEIKKFSRASGELGSASEQLQLLRLIGHKLGKSAIYILIDRVDELPITGTGSSSYDFIAPILSNLQLLELQGYGFKFFLWDNLLQGYQKHARPDRIKYYVLSWSESQLQTMLIERLKAYSQGRVSSIDQLTQAHGGVDQYLIHFGLGSPRTIIRMCKEILDQQSELNPEVGKLSYVAVARGITTFAKHFAYETTEPNTLRELKKLRQVNFTVRHISSDVFKFTQQAGIAKIKTWQDVGVVEKIGSIQELSGSRPSNLYGLTHPLVGKYILSDLSPQEFAGNKLRLCDVCNTLLIRDWDTRSEATCHRCDTEVIWRQ